MSPAGSLAGTLNTAVGLPLMRGVSKRASGVRGADGGCSVERTQADKHHSYATCRVDNLYLVRTTGRRIAFLGKILLANTRRCVICCRWTFLFAPANAGRKQPPCWELNTSVGVNVSLLISACLAQAIVFGMSLDAENLRQQGRQREEYQ